MNTPYLSVEEARQELALRWDNKDLEKAVNEYLQGDVPAFLADKPHVVLFRHIASANGEAERLLKLSHELDIDPLCLEYYKDKFVPINEDKYFLLSPSIFLNKKNDGRDRLFRMKIADLHSSQGKPFDSIKTLWGESLIDFHHSVLFDQFPELRNRTFDMSDWLKRNGDRARLFYEKFSALLMRNCVLADHLEMKGIEGEFIKNVLFPAFEKATAHFGLKPLVVQLAPQDFEGNAVWWYPNEKIKDKMDLHILKQKNRD
jgi:hypothetical protein